MKNIKKLLVMLPIVAVALLAACSDDDDSTATYVAPTAEGTYTDERDGETYRWVRYGNLDWMADNFRHYVGGGMDSLYVDADGNTHLAELGRLYTATGAKAATPDGWRLPTDDDWKQLEMTLGMSRKDADKTEQWRGNIAGSMFTARGDTTALGLRYGGYFTPNTIMGMTGFRFISAYAWYWTSTTDSDKGEGYTFGRKFIWNRTSVWRGSFDNKLMFSVRYVRDAQ